jgi:WD40 repeat protein
MRPGRRFIPWWGWFAVVPLPASPCIGQGSDHPAEVGQPPIPADIDQLTFEELQAEFGRLYREGNDALAAKRYDDALAAFSRGLELSPFDRWNAYGITCAYSLKGDVERGLRWLALTAEWGMAESHHDVLADPDLALLRADPRFEEIFRGFVRNREAEEGTLAGMDRDSVAARRREREQLAAITRRTPIAWLDGHASQVTGLRFDAAAERFITWGEDGAAWLWNAHTGEALGSISPISRQGVSFEFSGDGERLLLLDLPVGLASLWDGRAADPIATLQRGDEVVTAAAISPDNRLAATGDALGAVRLWDAATGEMRPLAIVSAAAIDQIEFGPKGDRLLARDQRGVMTVWDLATGREMATFGHAQRQVTSATFSADGARVLCGCTGPAAVVVACDGQSAPVEFAGSGEDAWASVHWADDGRKLLVSAPGGTGTIRVAAAKSAPSGSIIAELSGLPVMRARLMLDPTGRRLVTVTVEGAILWDLADGRRLADLANAPHPGIVQSAFSGNGSLVAMTNYVLPSPEVRIWDTATGALQGVLRVEGTVVRALSFTDSGSHLGIAAVDRSAYTWDGHGNLGTRTPSGNGAGRVLRAVGHFRTKRGLLAPDGRAAVAFADASVAGADDSDDSASTCRLWDLATGATIRPLRGHATSANQGAFTADSKQLVAGGSGDGHGHGDHIKLIDVESGNPVREFIAGPWQHVAVSPDGSRVLGRGSPERIVVLFDAATAAPLARIRHVQPYGSHEGDHRAQAAFSADGALIATAHLDGSIGIWDARDGARKGTLRGHTNVIIHIAFATKRNLLATVGRGLRGEVRIWDADRLEARDVFRGHEGWVHDAAFDSASARIASAGEDHTVRVWTLGGAAGAGVPADPLVLRGHRAPVNSCAFSPDDSLVLSGSSDGTARLWDSSTGAIVAVLEGHTGDVVDGAFTADGQRILTTGRDGTLRVWHGRTGQLLATRVEYAGAGWLTFDAAGYYAFGGAAPEWARFSGRDASCPLSSYAGILHDPARVRASLAGHPARPPILPSPPEVRLASPRSGITPDRTVIVDALLEDRYAVESVTVMQDDAPIDAALVRAALSLEPGGRRGRLTLPLQIPPHRSDTTIRVRAANVRGIHSAVRSARVQYEAPTRDLYLLALGVSDYNDDSLDLACPVRDVDDLIRRLSDQEKSFYSRVHVQRLVNAEVTPASLQRLERTFLLQAKPEDTIIVFAAGHGMRNNLNEYWFLTSTATIDDPYTGIGREALEELVTWEKLHAERRILLLDTCHSGSMVGRRGVSRLYEKDDVDALMRESRTGLYILAASSSDEFAREQRGNGVFTAAVLEAIEGAADRTPHGNGNGLVEIEEIKKYAEEQVLARSGGQQRPTFPEVRGGENFPVARVPPRPPDQPTDQPPAPVSP